MTTKDLIEILLDKCALDAEVRIVDDNGEFLSDVEFIEFDITGNEVLLYDSEPNYEECQENIEVQISFKKTGFAATTYRRL
jgi:hypothetical protein